MFTFETKPVCRLLLICATLALIPATLINSNNFYTHDKELFQNRFPEFVEAQINFIH